MSHSDNRFASTTARRFGAYLLATALIGTTLGTASHASDRGGDTFNWVATNNMALWGIASNWSGPVAQVPGPGDTAVFGSVAPDGGSKPDAVSTIDRAINRLEITEFIWDIKFQGGGGARKTLILESGDIDTSDMLFFSGDLALNAPGSWNINGLFFELNGGLSAPFGFTKTGGGEVRLGGFGPGTVQTGPIQLQDGSIEVTGPLFTPAVHTVGDGVGPDGDALFEYNPGQSTSVGFIVNRDGRLRLQDQTCCDTDVYTLGPITLNGGQVTEVDDKDAPTFQFASLSGIASLNGGVPVPGLVQRWNVRIGGASGTITVSPLAGFEDDVSLQISFGITAGDLLVTGGGVLEFINYSFFGFDNNFGSLTVNDATLLLNRAAIDGETIAPITTLGNGVSRTSARGGFDSVMRVIESNQMDDDAVLTVRSDGQLDLQQPDDIAELHMHGGSVAGNGSLAMLNQLVATNGEGGVIGARLRLQNGPNTFDIASGTPLTVTGMLTGPNAELVKTGGGDLVLLGATGSYGGLTRVENGRLNLSFFANLPASIVRISSGASLAADGATIAGLQGDPDVETLLSNDGLTVDYEQPVPITYDGDVLESSSSAGGGFTKTGAGRQNLTGQLNYTGPTMVQEGVLGFAGQGIINSSRVQVAAGATMNIENANANQVTFQRLTGAGNVVLGDRNLRLDLDPAVNDTFSGEISGSGALRLRGGGTQTLAGGSSYTGETSITQDTTLILANPGAAGSATGPGDVVINNGTLAGDGLINPGPDVNRLGEPVGNDITLTSGTIAPGSPTARGGDTGTLILTVDPFTEGVLNLDGGVIEFDLGTESDLILFADDGPHLRGTGTTLALNLGPGFSYDETYTLFANVTNSDAFFNFANVTGTDGQQPINIFHNPDLNAYQISFTKADTCPADLDGDGFVNVFDLLELLAGWGMDGSGADLAPPLDTVNVFDLLEMLSAWGTCP